MMRQTQSVPMTMEPACRINATKNRKRQIAKRIKDNVLKMAFDDKVWCSKCHKDYIFKEDVDKGRYCGVCGNPFDRKKNKPKKCRACNYDLTTKEELKTGLCEDCLTKVVYENQTL